MSTERLRLSPASLESAWHAALDAILQHAAGCSECRAASIWGHLTRCSAGRALRQAESDAWWAARAEFYGGMIERGMA